MRASFLVAIAACTALAGACSSPSAPPAPMLSQEQLQDPTICKQCHDGQYGEWASSMHAYAADDPVFLAMNARGQRETGGALGTFCVQCHAPLAVRAGLTTDGLNLASVPSWAKGVTCFFCHTAGSAGGSNDDPVVLAGDGVMRAAITDEADGAPHAGAYSLLHDQHILASSQLCGSCHDVTNQHGVAIETTFAEWTQSEYARLLSSTDNTRSCPACHMPSRQGQAATYPASSPTREIHDHSMAGVDVALIPYPGIDTQRSLVQQQLDAAVGILLCVSNGAAKVTLQSQGVGHSWPSGAVQDRRAWVELVAKSAGQIVFQTGVVPDGQSVMSISDPNLWLFREPMFDAANKEVPFLWQAMSVGTISALPAPADIQGPGAAHSVTREFALPPNVDEVDARVRIVPIDQKQLDDLVSSGDLDSTIRAAMPVVSLAGASATWTARSTPCVP